MSKKDITTTYKAYLQTAIKVKEHGNKYGDENTLRILERNLYEEPKQKVKKKVRNNDNNKSKSL